MQNNYVLTRQLYSMLYSLEVFATIKYNCTGLTEKLQILRMYSDVRLTKILVSGFSDVK